MSQCKTNFLLTLLKYFSILLILSGCSEGNFSGNAKQPVRTESNNAFPQQYNPNPVIRGQGDITPQGSGDIIPSVPAYPQPGGTFIPDPVIIQPQPTVRPQPTVQPQPRIIDNTEVYDNCAACKQRASQLASSAGFYINSNSTFSLGPYLVDPSLGICDIHFLKNEYVPISQHGPTDGIGDEQVFLYCPCNCGWKQYSGF